MYPYKNDTKNIISSSINTAEADLISRKSFVIQQSEDTDHYIWHNSLDSDNWIVERV